MQEDCIFCKIAQRDIPATLVYEDDTVIAFEDINPAAPVHILVIPRAHIANLMEITAANSRVIEHIVATVAPQIVKARGLEEKGFRLVLNTKEDGGQTVGHLHFHILGGRAMDWPPG